MKRKKPDIPADRQEAVILVAEGPSSTNDGGSVSIQRIPGSQNRTTKKHDGRKPGDDNKTIKETMTEVAADLTGQTPAKRKRGRPKGSKNRKDTRPIHPRVANDPQPIPADLMSETLAEAQSAAMAAKADLEAESARERSDEIEENSKSLAHMLSSIDSLLAAADAESTTPAVFTPKQQKQLDSHLPPEALQPFEYIDEKDGKKKTGYSVPAIVTEYLAQKIFNDQWDTTILGTQILFNGRSTIVENGTNVQKVMVIVQATVRVTMRGVEATKCHDGVGVGQGLVNVNESPFRAYSTAFRAAVTNAQHNALQHFGRVFGAFETKDRDGVINTIRARQKTRIGGAPIDPYTEAQDAFPTSGHPAVDETVPPAEPDNLVPDVTCDITAKKFPVMGCDKDDDGPVTGFDSARTYIDGIVAMIKAIPDQERISRFEERNRPLFEKMLADRHLTEANIETIVMAIDSQGLAVPATSEEPTMPVTEPAKPATTKPKAGRKTRKPDPKPVEPAADGEMLRVKLHLDDESKPKNAQAFGQALIEDFGRAADEATIDALLAEAAPSFNFLEETTVAFLKEKAERIRMKFRQGKAA